MMRSVNNLELAFSCCLALSTITCFDRCKISFQKTKNYIFWKCSINEQGSNKPFLLDQQFSPLLHLYNIFYPKLNFHTFINPNHHRTNGLIHFYYIHEAFYFRNHRKQRVYRYLYQSMTSIRLIHCHQPTSKSQMTAKHIDRDCDIAGKGK